MTSPKQHVHRYLDAARDAMIWKLDGLSEYDQRRPMTPTGTNLLGMIKHLASVELGYFGETFGRPSGEAMPWFEPSAPFNADMFAAADETVESIMSLYERARAHADETIDTLELDATGRVPWWPDDRNEVTLLQVITHMIFETSRHGGHADIVREMIDGEVGLRDGNDNMPPADDQEWAEYRGELETIARRFAG